MDDVSNPRAEGAADRSSDPASGVTAAPSTVRNTLVAAAMFVGRAVFAFGAAAIVAQALGADGRGRVVFVSNLAGLLALAASSGTATGINRLHAASRAPIAALTRAAVVVGVLAGLLVCGGLVGVAVLVSQESTDVPGMPAHGWLLLGVAMVALIVFSNLSQVAALENRLGAVTVTALLGAAWYVAWTVVTAAAGSISVLNNLVGWAISSILPTILLAATMLRHHADAEAAEAGTAGAAPASGGGLVAELAVISLRANVAGLAILAIWRIDVLLVEHRRGFSELGLYSVAVALAEVVVVMAMALRSAMLPHHGGDDHNLVEVIMRTTRVALVATTALAAALAAVSPILLGVMFGAEYTQTYPALLLLLPGTVFLVLHYPLFDYVAARGSLSALTALGVVSVVFNIAANYWALGQWSYVASAVVSSLTYALVFFGCVWLFLDRTGRSTREVLALRRADVEAASALVRRAPRPVRGSGVRDRG